ncbi:hypothetical protein PV10_03040 [Exophiala mesophila]|uniref:Uncharacterized protein n=1 Tax=Exophiala mesophila TaxID=212818 RepID=A0A0D1Y3X0_EXOME|nr:uncharacterized protein PV10_03040 [Exophiala mesophila]KIV95376.1 hypothetical protein PV10_03040 [Exophiala mesophila]
MLYNVPRDIFEDMKDVQRSRDAWNENFGSMGQSDLIMDRLMDHQTESSTEVLSLISTSLDSSSPCAMPHFQGVLIAHMDDEVVDDIAVNTAAGGFSVWIFCQSGVARLYNIFAAQDETSVSYVREDGVVRWGLGKEPEQVSAFGSGTKKGRHASVHVRWV